MAATSGFSSRSACGVSIGDRSSAAHAAIAALSSRTGRVASCTTTHTTAAITASSAARRHSVSTSTCYAIVRRSSSVSATWIVASPKPTWPETGCSSAATGTGWPREVSS